MSEYEALVNALKNLSQGEEPNVNILPMAEDEWNTRPDTVSYGIVSLDFEAGAMRGDGLKADTAYEGSVDLFSLVRSGAGWVQLITGALDAHCGASWELNSHTWERETGLFHWEWVFQTTDAELPEEPAPTPTPEAEPEPEDEPEGEPDGEGN